MMRFAVPMRLSIPRAIATRGYGVSAVGTFTFTPASGGTGGKSVTPADLGIGFPGLSLAFPGESISAAAGFDYDPGLIESINGKSPFTGVASGRATLADLLAGREIFRISRHPGNRSSNTEDLDVAIKLAVKPQYFTPGSFTGTIRLSITQ